MLSQFNAMPADQAADLIRPCVDNERWITAVVAGRPYDSVDAALEVADRAAATWSAADVDRALAQHPRIGERADGDTAEAELSRREQAATGIDDTTEAQLLTGNRAYEARFGRVFLIRAAGRSATQILAELTRRLDNTAEDEAAEASRELAQIAALRLEGLLAP